MENLQDDSKLIGTILTKPSDPERIRVSSLMAVERHFLPGLARDFGEIRVVTFQNDSP